MITEALITALDTPQALPKAAKRNVSTICPTVQTSPASALTFAWNIDVGDVLVLA